MRFENTVCEHRLSSLLLSCSRSSEIECREMRENVKSGARTKKQEGGGVKERKNVVFSFSIYPSLSPSHFFVLAPLFAYSLISRRAILDDLLQEKRRLLTVYVSRQM